MFKQLPNLEFKTYEEGKIANEMMEFFFQLCSLVFLQFYFTIILNMAGGDEKSLAEVTENIMIGWEDSVRVATSTTIRAGFVLWKCSG